MTCQSNWCQLLCLVLLLDTSVASDVHNKHTVNPASRHRLTNFSFIVLPRRGKKNVGILQGNAALRRFFG